jgi:hypothetical protein
MGIPGGQAPPGVNKPGSASTTSSRFQRGSIDCSDPKPQAKERWHFGVSAAGLDFRRIARVRFFVGFADVSYGHQYLATNYTKPGSKPSTKGKVIMGDKSPKAVQKQSAQKQVKANADAQKKRQAAAAKQVPGKK